LLRRLDNLKLIFRQIGMPSAMPVSAYLETFGQIFHQDLTSLTADLDMGTMALSIPQQLTLWWLAGLEWYLAQQARGLPVLAVRYADLVARREQVVRSMLEYCGLPTTQMPELLAVFARDAQAGTALARANPHEGNHLRLSAAEVEEMGRILQRHPVVKTFDFVVPGTLRVSVGAPVMLRKTASTALSKPPDDRLRCMATRARTSSGLLCECQPCMLCADILHAWRGCGGHARRRPVWHSKTLPGRTG
jgi:hypothetical protein